jgi:hypothetical protein
LRQSHVFQYQRAEFYAPLSQPPKTINLFQQFAFTEIITDDFTIIRAFLNHIKHVIWNDNKNKYDYFISWWASLIPKCRTKIGSISIIYGPQGSGKSMVIEIRGSLLGKLAMLNIDDLDKVFGKFNGMLTKYLLMIINETPEAKEVWLCWKNQSKNHTI